jgi:hypothetical protein
MVHDERWGFAKRDVELTDVEAALLNMCWQVTSWRAIRDALGDRFGEVALEAAAAALDAQGFVMREGVNIIALPLRQPGFRRAPAWPELREGALGPFGDTGMMDLAAIGVRQPEAVG